MTDRLSDEGRDKSSDLQDPGYRYHLLRAATERFQCSLAGLDPAQRSEAQRQAEQTFALEKLVLSSAEARDMSIPDEQVQRAFAEVAGRYDDAPELDADLTRNELDAAGLRLALRRELLFDAVMQRVGAASAAITETDERLFYELHHQRFVTPERRAARHILITVNDDYAENTSEAARARLEAIADQLRIEPGDNGTDAVQGFAHQAQRHSECPSAVENGKLGTLTRGQLYPQVDTALFALEEGAVSGIVESPLGLHLVLCERIQPAHELAFNQVRSRIRTVLEQRRLRETQRAWLAELLRRCSAAT